MNYSISTIVLLGLGSLVGSMGLWAPGAIAAPRRMSPVIRANPNARQIPTCYIEMPNQGAMNLDGLCEMGRPKTSGYWDMTTDRDKDGIPDALVEPFTQMSLAMPGVPSVSEAEYAARINRFMDAFDALNSRVPYSPESAAAVKEMSKLMRQSPPGSSNPAAQTRMSQLSEQLDKDPTYTRLRSLYQQYEQKRYEQSAGQPPKPTPQR
jgi:hypothetical protein